MISITKFLIGTDNFGDSLRYRHGARATTNGTNVGHGPVVAWNMTRSCNLKCAHCYMDSDCKKYEGELTHEEGMNFIDDLGKFKVPVLLFSGGEPLIREDFFELAEHAVKRNIRSTISTNGTLITRKVAERLKSIGVGYVGISLDGLRETNDRFRGEKGAFDSAVRGIENCVAVGQRVGLRFTINRHNYRELQDIFKLIEELKIDRACFYHLVYCGRGNQMMQEDLSHEESRRALDLIMEKTLDFHRRGLNKEILTVDNHADGIYLYMKLREKNPERAEEVYRLMKMNGGNRSGIAFANVDSLGNVHPDQFTQKHTLGNIREKSFGEIWGNTAHPILAGLKDRKPLLKGRCSRCKWLDVCNGNFRARAEAVTGDFWEADPACYLTEEEITGGIKDDYILEYNQSV
ncbi:putative heme d1 biosynthesis radical SAM protein NirJ1 [Clostridium formicaceticum]|uniref:Mycofactocin maturase MftC n=1 Tax=Clostridium formicaceticum TaxID=1497 RepID=A0AAC9WJ99_9CLOT|nr:putative heme d1 biosynthesis radical SAM protein NirJ1 [Clostridium formicaceticum]AOY74878.1 putative heme d1 biosynthesis radical SAM protein NirJ1 [Clostridium formicaceticum]ARE89280.1 Antilisterial bacteriocin subtilosin biosynthesis protein AlbA [Clostridium formicaceticum]